MSNPKLHRPAPFWDVRVHDLTVAPSLSGLCVGYELGTWRAEQFADHIMEWLPDFALTYSELAGVHSGNMVPLMREAAKKVYKSKKFENRGEFGELFLHVAVRQVFNSLPAISKIYYKSARNEIAKGFDAVHVVGPPESMELWIGEAKFYDEISGAIRKVIAELKAHTERDYLRDEFLLIKGKVDNASQHAEQLRNLLSTNTSLDTIFKRIRIPVLLTYDSECLGRYCEVSTEYCTAFEKEIRHHHVRFLEQAAAELPSTLTIHLFLFPLHTKKILIEALDKRLRSWQEI